MSSQKSHINIINYCHLTTLSLYFPNVCCVCVCVLACVCVCVLACVCVCTCVCVARHELCPWLSVSPVCRELSLFVYQDDALYKYTKCILELY